MTCNTPKFLLCNATGLTKMGCQVEFILTSPHLADFWPFKQRKLVQHAPHRIIDINSENCTKNTTNYPLSNSIGLTQFGYSRNKL